MIKKIVKVQAKIIVVGICLINDLMVIQSFTEEQNETKEVRKRFVWEKADTQTVMV